MPRLPCPARLRPWAISAAGLSITIPIDWADELIARNIHSLMFIGITSILIVTAALFLMFESLIVHRDPPVVAGDGQFSRRSAGTVPAAVADQG